MSFYEILVILIVALIVIKPERLPEASYFLGRIIGKIQHAIQQFLLVMRHPRDSGDPEKKMNYDE